MNHEVRRAPEAPDEENAHDQPPFRLEDLRGADLRGKDLTRVEGLLPEHLAGADLTGAKLPDDLAKFPTLSQVTAISSEARKIFIGLIAGCVYCWLVMGTTRDVDLILNTASSPLPIINTPIPIAGFYVIGAALLAGVYCYLHFYLHHLWRNLAALPAVFPDGIALDDRSDPWLLTKFVRVYFVRLNPDKHPLKRLETVLSVGLAWALVPLTLFALWARYLPSHDPLGTYWLGILTMFTMVLGWHFFRYARATLRGEAPPSKGPGVRGAWRELRALGSAGRTFFFLVAFTPLFLALCSYAVFHVDPHETRTWAQRGLIGLRLLGIRTYADLREVELAERPEGWTGREWSTVKRVDLRGRNLAFADATRAFLANADLRGATLTGAIFNSAELRGAVLYDDDGERGAQAQGINFRGAKLQDVDLRGVNLKGANLVEAQLHGADLRHAQLQGANLSEANFQGADLRTAQLQGANLSKGQFQGADLRRAKLQCANLSFAQLQGANLRDAELHMAGLGSFQGRRAGPWGLVPGYGDPQLQGADLRGLAVWRARGMFERSELADFRGFHVRPLDTPELKALTEAGRCVPDEVEPLPARPPLPDDWQLAPNVMFREGDPEPEPLDWGRHKWATVEAYDQDLAKQLVDLACGRDTPEAQARALARRALSDLADHADDPWGDPDRLWPRLFAARVSGPDCPQARRLPEDLRRPLDELAILDHAVVTSPAAYPPYPAE